MNIKCLFLGHIWRFSYHHGMPLGISTNEALNMIDSGRYFPVYECKRCRKQSRIVNNKRVMLQHGKIETP